MRSLLQRCLTWLKDLSALQRAGLALGLLLASVWLAQQAPAGWLLPLGSDRAWERVTQEGMLHVGMDASYPPFENVDDDGQFVGLDVDLAQALGQRWGVEVVLVNIHFDGLYDAIEAGRCDVIISALPFDRMLTQDVLYSQSYFNAGHVLLTRPGTGILSADDLQGHTVAVELGAGSHQLAKLLQRDRGIDLEILALREADQVLAALRDGTADGGGQADALICDRVTAYGYHHQAPELLILEPALSEEPLVIAAPIDAHRLMAEINAALSEWLLDGTLDAWQAQWFR